jgi:hypothetical protein
LDSDGTISVKRRLLEQALDSLAVAGIALFTVWSTAQTIKIEAGFIAFGLAFFIKLAALRGLK